jgi:ribonuclease-3
LIASIYLDGGFAAASTFILQTWRPLLRRVAVPRKDAKTKLQEWAQARALPLPAYHEVSREGPAHAPSFVVQVSTESLEPARAHGPSKRIAEQEAARIMLERLVDRQGRAKSHETFG